MHPTFRILLPLLLGVSIGLGLVLFDPTLASTVSGWSLPVGKLWLNAMQMTVVPLVGALVIIGVNTAADAATSGRLARNALLVFVALLLMSTTFGALTAPQLLAWLPRDESAIAAFRAGLPAVDAPTGGNGLAVAFTTLIPANAIAAATANAMLPLVSFCLFFGFALTRILPERRARMLEFVQSIADAMIVIVRWVLWAAPLGVFALVLSISAHVGFDMLGALAGYIGMQCILYTCVILMLYVVVRVVAGEPLRRYAAAILPAQVVAMSTQSSLAALPAMIDSTRNRLGYPLQVTSMVVPMAISLFRVISPVKYVGVSCFIAWLYGIEPTWPQVAMAIGLAVVISMGSVGLPGQANFMATSIPIAQVLGVPLEPIAVLMAVDTIPDVVCTLGNVTGGLSATSVVNRFSDITEDDAPSV